MSASQDQIQSAFGGLNRIDIRTDGSFEVAPLVVRAERLAGLQKHLLLLYTGLSRHASEIAAEQVATIGSKAAELKAMRAMVDEGEKHPGRHRRRCASSAGCSTRAGS